MARDINHLYLHLAQLRIEGDYALTRKYHTPKINELIKENNRLVEAIANSDKGILSKFINLFYDALWFIGKSHSYIVSSTSDDVRSEVFSCLRFVLKDWIPNPETYVIICSQGEYEYHSFFWNDNDFYDEIESTFGFKYGMKMIPIKMPFHMQRDFLFNAALYHEIGHFIDRSLKITASIIEDVKTKGFTIPQADVYLKDLKYDLKSDPANYYKQLTSFLKEYLADLFAARYTGKSIFYYLKYVNPKGEAGYEHPSIKDREDLVDEFLGDSGNYGEFLKMLTEDTKDVKDNPLRPLSHNIDISSFVDLKECGKPASDQHIHSIIPNLWDIWNNRRDEFKNPDGSPMNFIEIYRNLMDLTAKAVQKLQ